MSREYYSIIHGILNDINENEWQGGCFILDLNIF